MTKWVEQGPEIDKDGVVRWRRADLARKIKEQLLVVLHERSVGRLLRGLGFCRISVRPRHPKADPAAQEMHKKVCRAGRRCRSRRGAWKADQAVVAG